MLTKMCPWETARSTWRSVLIALFLARPLSAAAVPTRLARAEPEEVGMRSARLQVIDTIVAEGIKRKQMPGAVVLVARHGRIVYHQAFGFKQLEPSKIIMTTDTVFDMASLTKPIATATSIMVLTGEGKVHPRDLVVKHIPEFVSHGKDKITIHQLLTHQSGLMADNALQDYEDGPDIAMQRIYELKPVAQPGSRFIYSDVGFIVLADIVRRVSSLDVHQFSQKHVFQPLGMNETGYLPTVDLRDRAATTQTRDGKWLKGEVHDPRAHRLGGIAGHAGLFSTARDLAVHGQMLLGGGDYHGVRVLHHSTVARMTKAYHVPGGGLRGLGWDVRTGYSSNRGDLLSARAFGHGGFTGTTFWVDPELQLQVIFLSNRVHPDGKGSVNTLAGRIGTVAAAAIADQLDQVGSPRSIHPPVAPRVLTGIDVLQQSNMKQLRGRRIGLITNHTGINKTGVPTSTILHEANETNLVVLFSPEHGIRGQLDTPHIGSSRDAATGLTVFSLYGESRRPTPESLQGIDTLVFDIQDIGTRFYTYVSTMGNAMEAAAEHHLRFVVLDRPNPINGIDVSGPILDAGSESFVGFHSLPVRHGMTVGELARMFNTQRGLGLDLWVIPMQGWQRRDFYDTTGLLWLNPSPNMRNLNQALLYPGMGLLETTNVSVGRGTDTPFEVLGAPWLDGQLLAELLNGSDLPGVRCVPIRFTPKSSKFAGIPCGGINLVVTDRVRFRSVRTGLEIARQLRLLCPDQWDTSPYNRLLKNKEVLGALVAGKTVDELEAIYRPKLESFRQRRRAYLLYE